MHLSKVTDNQSAAGQRGPLGARDPWHSAIVPPPKDGPASIASPLIFRTSRPCSIESPSVLHLCLQFT